MSSYVLSILSPLILMAVAGVTTTGEAASANTHSSENIRWAESTEIRESSVRLANGIRLTYAEQGNPNGIPVILLHGWTDSWHSFSRAMPYLPESFRVIAPTLRGHGDSDDPAEGYKPEDFASDLELFMDALEIESAFIAGWSMGSYVAQRFAIDNPERTKGVLLMGTPTNLDGKDGTTELWNILTSLEDPIDPEFVREFNAGVPVVPVPDEFLEIINRENLKVPARVWRDAFMGVWKADFSEERSRLTAPALVIWGDQEKFTTTEEQRALAASLPEAELKKYSGHGHALHWEAPKRFAEDLTAFVMSISERQ